MTLPASSINPELEDFRRQWREEVSTKAKAARIQHKPEEKASSGSEKISVPTATATQTPNHQRRQSRHDTVQRNFQFADQHLGIRRDDSLPDRTEQAYEATTQRPIEPHSALEHYEKAEERESQGKLGDSVSLYRKAFRLDAGVEHAYREKHRPSAGLASKPQHVNPSNAPVTVPNPAHHSLDGPPAHSPTSSQLIASFADAIISSADPASEASSLHTCPLSILPSEILIHILYDLAILDVGSFSRLSLVCKRFAFLITTEDRIWRRVSDGFEFGFAAMHYKWARSISGMQLPMSLQDYENSLQASKVLDSPLTRSIHDELPDLSSLSLDTTSQQATGLPGITPNCPTYREVLRSHPRIRFNGCYISTVNYQRPGASSSSQVSWNTPIHIVTYYRYLRFYRDGTCISLLTTHEPAEVVHHLSRDNLPVISTSDTSKRRHPHIIQDQVHHDPNSSSSNTSTAAAPTAKAIMSSALIGRWHLSPCPSSPSYYTEPTTLHIETLGHDPQKYTFVMSLLVTSASTNARSAKAGGAKNTKLAWRGFWSYNKLTDDWAEFGLKNDKAFWWSRVASYGLGMDAGV